MICPFEYEIKIFESDEKTERIVHGITFGNNYADAVENIESYYGDTIIEILHVFMNDACSVYEFEETNDEFGHGLYKCAVTKWW